MRLWRMQGGEVGETASWELSSFAATFIILLYTGTGNSGATQGYWDMSEVRLGTDHM